MANNAKKKEKTSDEDLAREILGKDSRFKLSSIDVDKDESTKKDEESLVANEDLVSGQGFDVKKESGEGMLNLFNENAGFTPDGKSSTKVTVLTKNSIEEINHNDLKRIIKETQDIKQVVIEQMRMKEGARVRLLFDLEKEGHEKIEEDVIHAFDRTKENQQISEDVGNIKVNLRSLERKINLRILKNLEFYNKNEPIIVDQKIAQEQENGAKVFKPQEMANIDQEKNIGTDTQEKSLMHIEGADFDQKDLPVTQAKVEYERSTYTRKKKKINKSYYKVKNHVDLYKTGSSYLEDYNKGMRSFGFSSIGVEKVRQKSVFGITTFFNYHSGAKVNIFTSQFQQSFYRDYLDDLEEKKVQFLSGLIEVNAYCDEGVEIIDMDELEDAIL